MTAAVPASGCSTSTMCPAPGIVTRRAPGMTRCAWSGSLCASSSARELVLAGDEQGGRLDTWTAARAGCRDGRTPRGASASPRARSCAANRCRHLLAVVCARRVGHERRSEHVAHDLLGHATPGPRRRPVPAGGWRGSSSPSTSICRRSALGHASRAEPDEDQRADAIGVAGREAGADEAADRRAHPVAAIDAQLVEQRDRVVVEALGPQEAPRRLGSSEAAVALAAVVVPDAPAGTAQRGDRRVEQRSVRE